MLKFAVIIPTLNAGEQFKHLLAAIPNQTWQPARKVIIDSSSADDTVTIAKDFGYEVYPVQRETFNHGATRQYGVEIANGMDVVLLLTQDVELVNSTAFEKLITGLAGEKVGAAYGRQLPRAGANPIEAHARLFNYGPESLVKSLEDIPKLGIKAAFISNSFAAYRYSALKAVDGFPAKVIFGEDTYVAAKMILNHWKIVYSAEATVYHSHHYGYPEEFRRYFDIGVFHAGEPWLKQKFGNTEGEGVRFVLSELKYLQRHNFWLIPSAFIRSLLKLLAYKLGYQERWIPKWIKIHLSMNRKYWN